MRTAALLTSLPLLALLTLSPLPGRSWPVAERVEDGAVAVARSSHGA